MGKRKKRNPESRIVIEVRKIAPTIRDTINEVMGIHGYVFCKRTSVDTVETLTEKQLMRLWLEIGNNPAQALVAEGEEIE